MEKIREPMDKHAKFYSIWLNATRGLASLVVLFSHSRLILFGSVALAVGGTEFATEKSLGGTPQPELSGFGHMAVIVFFVLSGYLVGGGALRSVRKRRWSASNYAIARISRLWTVLIPVLLLGYAIDHIGVELAQPGSIYFAPPGQIVIKSSLPEAMQFKGFLGNLFFLQEIFVMPFGTNFPLWTLAYEFWFYAAFPFLLFLLWPATRPLKRVGCGVALLLIFLLVGHKIALYFCFWLFGATVELVPKRLSERTASYLAAAGNIAFIALLVAVLKAKMPVIVSDAIESFAFAGLCYVVVHLQQQCRFRLLSLGASGLSAISYTLYLVHAPILIFLCNLLMPVWRPWSFDTIGLARYISTTLGIFAIAVLLYWLFERRTPLVRAWMTRAYERFIPFG